MCLLKRIRTIFIIISVISEQRRKRMQPDYRSKFEKYIKITAAWDFDAPHVGTNSCVCSPNGEVIRAVSDERFDHDVLEMQVEVDDALQILELELAAGLFCEQAYPIVCELKGDEHYRERIEQARECGELEHRHQERVTRQKKCENKKNQLVRFI